MLTSNTATSPPAPLRGRAKRPVSMEHVAFSRKCVTQVPDVLYVLTTWSGDSLQVAVLTGMYTWNVRTNELVHLRVQHLCADLLAACPFTIGGIQPYVDSYS